VGLYENTDESNNILECSVVKNLRGEIVVVESYYERKGSFFVCVVSFVWIDEENKLVVRLLYNIIIIVIE